MAELIRHVNKKTKVAIRVDEVTAATLDSDWEPSEASSEPAKAPAKRRTSKAKAPAATPTEPPVEAATDATASD